MREAIANILPVVLEEDTESRPRPGHENIRGANYYDAGEAPC